MSPCEFFFTKSQKVSIIRVSIRFTVSVRFFEIISLETGRTFARTAPATAVLLEIALPREKDANLRSARFSVKSDIYRFYRRVFTTLSVNGNGRLSTLFPGNLPDSVNLIRINDFIKFSCRDPQTQLY